MKRKRMKKEFFLENLIVVLEFFFEKKEITDGQFLGGGGSFKRMSGLKRVGIECSSRP